MGNWKDKATFLTVPKTRHKVNDVELEFQPVSIKRMFELREFVKPISLGLSVLLSSNSDDTGHTEKKIIEQTGEGKDKHVINLHEITVSPIAEKTAMYRDKRKDDAISSLLDTATSDKGQDIIARLILDSLRDHFGNDAPTSAQFLEATSPAILSQMLVGVAKANKGMFGPLADRLEGVFANFEAKVTEKLAPKVAASVEQKTETQTPETNQTSKSG